ncbi:MAG: phage holin family protein [Burkholderiaceae bacterium]
MSREDPGLPDALARLGGRLFGMLQNRLELASVEFGEAGGRLVMTIVASFAAVLLLGGAVAALSAWVAVALWSTLGHAVLGWLALCYFGAGAGLLWWLRARLRNSPPLLADTLEELRVDAALLRGEDASRHTTGKRRP